jgi:hypothetical protein
VGRRGKVEPWEAPEPELRRAHDVRGLRFCQFCQAAGFGLPAWNGAPAHGYCIGAKFGSTALLGMPVAELMKVTVSEIQALGLLKVFMANMDRAKRREAEEPRTSPEAIRLRKAAQSFAALKPSHDDFDRAGQRADRELRAAAVAYARLLATASEPHGDALGEEKKP